MQNLDTIHAGFTHCLAKIGLTPSGHLQFADGARMIDLSEVTQDDIDMINQLCPLLADDHVAGGAALSAA